LTVTARCGSSGVDFISTMDSRTTVSNVAILGATGFAAMSVIAGGSLRELIPAA
jgi:hypothetical protein